MLLWGTCCSSFTEAVSVRLRFWFNSLAICMELGKTPVKSLSVSDASFCICNRFNSDTDFVSLLCVCVYVYVPTNYCNIQMVTHAAHFCQYIGAVSGKWRGHKRPLHAYTLSPFYTLTSSPHASGVLFSLQYMGHYAQLVLCCAT